MGRFVSVAKTGGVEVYVHWSAVAVAAVLLLGALQRPMVTGVAIAAFAGVMLVPALGQAIVARRRKCRVLVLEMYPFLGITRVDQSTSLYDEGIIVWGGVLAQVVVALPLVAWVVAFGYTPWESVNALLALLGFYNLVVAIFNLIPVFPLQGSAAWAVLPVLLRRASDPRASDPRASDCVAPAEAPRQNQGARPPQPDA